jgi:hypothetical protein
MGDIIACHTMSIADFWDFTEILNNNNHFCWCTGKPSS